MLCSQFLPYYLIQGLINPDSLLVALYHLASAYNLPVFLLFFPTIPGQIIIHKQVCAAEFSAIFSISSERSLAKIFIQVLYLIRFYISLLMTIELKR